MKNKANANQLVTSTGKVESVVTPRKPNQDKSSSQKESSNDDSDESDSSSDSSSDESHSSTEEEEEEEEEKEKKSVPIAVKTPMVKRTISKPVITPRKFTKKESSSSDSSSSEDSSDDSSSDDEDGDSSSESTKPNKLVVKTPSTVRTMPAHRITKPSAARTPSSKFIEDAAKRIAAQLEEETPSKPEVKQKPAFQQKGRLPSLQDLRQPNTTVERKVSTQTISPQKKPGSKLAKVFGGGDDSSSEDESSSSDSSSDESD